MGTVLSFSRAKSEQTEIRRTARNNAAGRIVWTLCRTPFLWLGQMLVAVLAVVGPIARTLGKIAIAFLIVVTLIEWADHWQRLSLLEIPASLIVFFVIVHASSTAIVRRFGDNLE